MTNQRAILQVVASSHGGGAVYMLTLARALARRGIDLAACMPDDQGHVSPRDFSDAGVRFHALGGGSASSLPQARALAGILRREAPDLLHAHGTRAAWWSYLALSLLRDRTTRLVYTVHGFMTPHYRLPRRSVQAAFERRIARRAAAVVAVASAEQRALEAAGLSPPGGSYLAPPALEIPPPEAPSRAAARMELGLPEETYAFLTVCRLGPPRDFEMLLRALSLHLRRFPQTRLLIVGDGPYRPRVEASVARLGLQGSVTLCGQHHDPWPFYAASDAFVLTSTGGDGLPIALLEAQAAGLPVVATDDGGTREALLPGRSGLLVALGDAVALSEALNRLAGQPDAAHAMGDAGRAFVRANFTSVHLADRMASIYDSV